MHTNPMHRSTPACNFLAALAGLALSATLTSVAHAGPIYGGPTYNSASLTGYQADFSSGAVAFGTAALTVRKFSGGIDLGLRAARWNDSGTAAVELGNLGTNPNGFTESGVEDINLSDTIVGNALRWNGSLSLGFRAVRWNASGTAATELGNLGTNAEGYTDSNASAINSTGTTVGYATKWGVTALLGDRAVRWSSFSTVATELGHIGTNSIGQTSCRAYAINSAGTAVGSADKYSGNAFIGSRAVRWNAFGTAATELGNLDTSSSGFTFSSASALNDNGRAVGVAHKYIGGVDRGLRAVRWDPTGTAATELGNLGTNSNGFTTSAATDVNMAGTTVGSADKYAGTVSLGTRAVRWDAWTTVATELGNLGTDSNGVTGSFANAINSAGTVVGRATKYTSGVNVGRRAVAWGSDGVAIDLNTLLSSTDRTRWTLTSATGITDTLWVTGIGTFDPDGALGGLPGYERAFLTQLPGPVCDSIDFNSDGLFPDDSDLVEFLSVFAGGPCSTGTCGDIDFNNDGLFPDDADLVAFLTVLAGGAC